MKIIHSLGPKSKERKNVNNVSFSLSNKKGDYIWMSEISKSRYEGWFCRLSKKIHLEGKRCFASCGESNPVYRIIESIEVQEGGEVLELVNGFDHFERKREKVEELFYLSELSHVFVYELSKKKKVDVYFDVRKSYSSAETKDYKLKREDGFLVLEFDSKIFLAIKCERGEDVNEIFPRYYEYDEGRNSPPFHRNVRKGVCLEGKRFVFALGESKKEAKKEAGRIFSQNFLKEEELDTLCVKNSLANLLVPDYVGAYAGIPWFFHFWPRDEAISLKSIISLNPQEGKKIFFRLLRDCLKEGPGGAINIDAPGWLFKRTADVLPFCSEREKDIIRRELKAKIEELLWSFTRNGFLVNGPYETWMDSLKRSGARIEMQAMKMNMYKTASFLSRNKGEKMFYKKMEMEMKEKTYRTFFDGNKLYDGYFPETKSLDKTTRPNLFIAAYIYPDLLSKKEWINCFTHALDDLWLSWGGVSTIDVKNNDFCENHTGESAESYHKGDSWFYLNNLIAIILYRFDRKRFSTYIKKIMSASEEEIMWKGAIGSHGEISSATKLESRGCINQAWSNAMYLEAKKEIES